MGRSIGLSMGMKAVYATLFLAACAAVLVIHVQDSSVSEDVKFEDPFLRTIKMNVVRRATARLKIREAKDATKHHIKSARDAMKQALLSAETENQDAIEKAEVAKVVEKAKKKKAAKTAAPAPKKQFTWDQLQSGQDAAKENFTTQKVDGLLGRLKSAPHAATKVAEEAPQVEKVDLLASALHKARTSVKKTNSADDD